MKLKSLLYVIFLLFSFCCRLFLGVLDGLRRYTLSLVMLLDVYECTVRELLNPFIPQTEQMQNPTDCKHYSQVC